jgi:HEAT repeat protein
MAVDIVHKAINSGNIVGRFKIEKRFPMEPNEIASLLADLRSLDTEKQIAAIQKTEEEGVSQAVPELLALLGSTNTDVRLQSAMALPAFAQEQPATIGAALLPLLQDEDEFVRDQATELLGLTTYQPALVPLTQILQHDPSWIVRCTAAEALRHFSDPVALPSIIHTLTLDQDENVRAYAANTLGIIASSTFLPDLTRILNQEQEEVVKIELLVSGYRLGKLEYLDEVLRIAEQPDSEKFERILTTLSDLITFKPPLERLTQDASDVRKKLIQAGPRFPEHKAALNQILENLVRLEMGIPPEPCVGC